MTPTGQKSTALDNIEEWTSAMLTLGAIYTERHPRAAPAMFKYVKTVRDMATRGGNWSFYDTQFRKQKARFNWQWDFIHWELHFNAMTKPVTKFPFISTERNVSQNNRNLQPFHIPRGFCWGYHKTGKCANPAPCHFKHACFRCGAKHAARWCTQQKRNRESDTSKPAITSQRS